MEDREAAGIAKALSHPLRLELIRAARDRRQVSPSEYTRESGEALGNVSYHVRMLEAAGVFAIVDTAKRRGALEHFYALTGPKAGIALEVIDLLATS